MEAYHVGQFILEEVNERKTPKKELAKALKILPSNLSLIFSGQRGISAKIAIRLGDYFGTTSEYWWGMQTSYELQEAKKKLIKGK